MKQLRIGFSGAARCGKDYAAQSLSSIYDGNILKVADQLYELMYLIQDYVGFERVKDRELLQWIGTDWGRGHDPNLWVNLFRKKIEAADPAVPIYVTDIRFPEEANLLKEQGFVLIRIDRANLPEADAPWRQHESERALDNYTKWDYHMRNCPDGEQFLEQVHSLIIKHYDLVPKRTTSNYRITPP